ncbi:MAG: hypothetical protein EXQ79_07095 [Acidimicrobiia bacterium]|nr:hypothetical protein [Acidimicrobiia bacterium]
MSVRARKYVASLIVVAALAAAVPAGAAARARRLPPSTRDELAQIFDAKVGVLGFKTTRALLQNLDTYASDPNGRHLAIYLEPMADNFTNAEYVASFDDVAKVFLPLVFKRWKGLKSFDVCLEPLPSDDASEVPPPVTQIQVTRRGARLLDWKDASLTDMLFAAVEYKATKNHDADVYVFFDDRLDMVPELKQARTESAQR